MSYTYRKPRKTFRHDFVLEVNRVFDRLPLAACDPWMRRPKTEAHCDCLEANQAAKRRMRTGKDGLLPMVPTQLKNDGVHCLYCGHVAPFIVPEPLRGLYGKDLCTGRVVHFKNIFDAAKAGFGWVNDSIMDNREHKGWKWIRVEEF